MSIKDLAPTYYTRRIHVLEEAASAKRLLNAGCGDGVYNHYLRDSVGKIVSFDINHWDVSMAKGLCAGPHLLYFVGDIKYLPLKSETFDCIVCTEVLEHLKEDSAAMRELLRVLAAGGRLIVTVPSKDFPLCYDPVNFVLNRLGKRLTIGAWSWGHERLYSIQDLRGKIDLKLIKTRRLSGGIVGLIENGYINSFLQRFVKSDPANRTARTQNPERIRGAAEYRAPALLRRLRDWIVRLDDRLFAGRRSRSIGLLFVFQK